MERVYLIISGRVQGVFFRKSAQEKALGLGLKGWVRNLEEGDVELVAEGDRAKLDEFIRWCKKGPSGAHVEAVKAEWRKSEGGLSGFQIVYS